MKKFVAVLLTSIAVAGSASAASLNTEAQTLETQFVDAFNHNKDGAKLASFFTEDGVTLAPNGAMTSGRSNLAKMYSDIAGHYVLANTLDQIHSQGRRRLGIDTWDTNVPRWPCRQDARSHHLRQGERRPEVPCAFVRPLHSVTVC